MWSVAFRFKAVEMGMSLVFGLNCACHLSIWISSCQLATALPVVQIHKSVLCTSSLQMSQEESTRFYDQLNHHIFELVSSSDANERKGGILAIGKDSLW